MPDVGRLVRDGLGGTYKLEREVGRGGMATVFLAHDIKHDRSVALKVLHPEVAAALGASAARAALFLSAAPSFPAAVVVFFFVVIAVTPPWRMPISKRCILNRSFNSRWSYSRTTRGSQ